MPQAVVDQLRGGPQADAVQGLEAGEADVLALTDAMTRDIEVPDALFAPLRSRYNDQELVELAATVAAYNMVSRFLVALRVGH
jgi:alkylhydroperoxidase family enzyme